VFFAQILSNLIFRKKIPQFKKIFFLQFAIGLLSLPNIFIFLYQGKLELSSWIKIEPAALLQSFKYFAFGSLLPYILFSFIAALFIVYKYSRKTAPADTCLISRTS